MKTLLSAQDKAEILERLKLIGPTTQRQWGKMTAAEMVCHLSDTLRVAMGERKAESVSTFFSRSVMMKWMALRLPMQWPHGISTVRECAARLGGTPPAEFARDVDQLRALFERFTQCSQENEFAHHPIFGKLSVEQWQRWGYLHMDHHLRQFGA